MLITPLVLQKCPTVHARAPSSTSTPTSSLPSTDSAGRHNAPFFVLPLASRRSRSDVIVLHTSHPDRVEITSTPPSLGPRPRSRSMIAYTSYNTQHPITLIELEMAARSVRPEYVSIQNLYSRQELNGPSTPSYSVLKFSPIAGSFPLPCWPPPSLPLSKLTVPVQSNIW
ncbi:hypothetical protein SERLA73DRAFT_79236 [Serpula lacrymans var. lacrymans S7.3]|uniref:Uncharacterized protein n=1 Tax=Serpula lacrymans var. lacrymans (strain S7.3) TaxID=936435 RepID=F8QFQ1_SERL3|nr:hypothetical protein SERLA73DRAFT_79236 [Serpula lacrymans var. lacrymans S7.3]